MDSRVRRSVAIDLGLAILLAIVAQFQFSPRVGFRWDGVILYAVAMTLFGIAVGRLEIDRRSREGATSRGVWRRFLQLLRSHPVRTLAASAGVGLVLYVTSVASHRPQDRPFWDLLVLWLGGVALTVGAFSDWRALPRGWKTLWRTLRRPTAEVSLLAIVTLVAFVLRLINLERIPYILSGDEAAMGLEAVDVLAGGRASPFVTGWFSNPTLYFFLQAFFVRHLGNTATALRLSSVLVSTATVVLLYLLAKRLYGWWVGLLAAVTLATYHYAIHFGRMGLNNVWDPFLALGAFYYLDRGLEEKRLGPLLAAGVFVGLSVYFSAGSRVLAVMLVVYCLYWVVHEPQVMRANLGNLAVLALVVTVIVLPLFSFFATHPNDMMAPWQRKAIFASGWVAEVTRSSDRSVLSLMADQFLKSVLAFNATTDVSPFYRPAIPLLQFAPSLLFVFGFAYACRHIDKREYLLLVMWFSLVILFGGVLLENPPAAHRLLMAIPPVVICVALGITRLLSLSRLLLNQPARFGFLLSLVLVLYLSYQSVTFYFRSYTPSHVYAGPNSEEGDRLGRYLSSLGPDYACYFFGAPRMYLTLPTIPFLAPDVMRIDVEERLIDRVAPVDPAYRPVFVFLPERLDELAVVRRTHPQGSLREFRDDADRLLFVAYEVEP